MKNGLKKAVVIGLSACLVFGTLSGCSKEETFDASAAAVKVNDDEISAGLVKFASHYSQSLMEDIYKMYMGSEDPMSEDLYGNGSTLGDMIKEDTASSLSRMVLAEQHMEEYGVELTDEEKAAISETASKFLEENDEAVMEQMAATQETVERYLTLRTIYSKMQTAMSADVDTEVSDDEAAQRRVQFVLFRAETEAETEDESELDTEIAETELAETESAETEAETAVLEEESAVKTQSADETELDETEIAGTEAESEEESETETEDPALAAAKEEARALAEQMIELVKSGEDFEEAAAAVDPDVNVSEQTFDDDSTTVADVLVTATSGVADDTLIEEPLEIDSGYYVAKVISQIDREATDEKKEEIVEERRSDRISELFDEWEEASEIENSASVLAAITFDFSLTQETEASVIEDETELAETEIVLENETEIGETEIVPEDETELAEETELLSEAETE